MAVPALVPTSDAWFDELFARPAARNVFESKATTIVPLKSEWCNTIQYCEGEHEHHAGLLLEFLWRYGLIRRYKFQPVDLRDLGGAEGYPDILLETRTKYRYLVAVKAHRYVSAEVQAQFDAQQEVAAASGMGFLCWTDKNVLRRTLSGNVLSLDKGYRFPCGFHLRREIELAAKAEKTLGSLLEAFGWDDTLSAAAWSAFYVDITKDINHETPLIAHSWEKYSNLFVDWNADRSWWGSLRPYTPD